MKRGLVLEGGGMRGMFTAGVIDVMMEQGVELDGLVGVSAGSSFGCNYKSRQPGRVLRYNMRFHRDPRYMGLRCFLKTGNFIGGEFAYHILPMQLDIFDAATFEANPMEFHVVCTDVATGKPVYYLMEHVDYESLEWLRASASMPIVSRPVKVDDGRLMLDGGISDSIPLQYFMERGFDRNVVVLTQPRNYFKNPAPRRLLRFIMPKMRSIAEALANRHLMYNAQLAFLKEQEELGNALVIAPSEPLSIGRLEMNPGKMTQIYQTGRDAALERIDEIKRYLAID